MLQDGLKTVEDHDQQIILRTAEIDTSRFQSNSKYTNPQSEAKTTTNGTASFNNSSYPHFSIPFTVSALYGRGDWSCLHKEDDVLVRRLGSPPQVRSSIVLIAVKIPSSPLLSSPLQSLSSPVLSYLLHYISCYVMSYLSTSQ